MILNYVIPTIRIFLNNKFKRYKMGKKYSIVIGLECYWYGT